MATKSSTRGKKPARRARTSFRQHLAPWARDALGIGLVVVALLSVLGLWFEAAGPVGRGIDWVLHATMGVSAVAFPVIAVYWGVLLLRGTAEDDRLRMFIGFALAFVGALALISLWRGNPRPLGGYVKVSDAAGFVGALAAHPLGKLVSKIGVAIVWGGAIVLGLLIFTGTALSAVVERVADRFRREDGDDLEDDVEAEPALEVPSHRSRVIDTSADVPIVELLDVSEEAFGDEEEDDLELGGLDEDEELEPIEVPELVRPTGLGDRYLPPPLDLLRTSPPIDGSGLDEEHTTEALERTFHTFNVPASVVAAHRGPTVTLYEVEVQAGTKVNKVLALADDIAYALATPDVRIIAPIPGKSAIGVEVPNKVRDFVMLGDILRSRTAVDDKHPLAVALGKDVHGRAQLLNLTKMPHLLIAGATGAGKSSLINCFVTSVLMRTSPDEVKMVLIDPKRVELSHFADLPHLLVPVIVHPKKAAEALAWVVREMEQRYELLAMVGVRDIDGYRSGLADGTLRIPPGQEEKVVDFPYLMVVIDELADLMMVAPRDVEDAICRIAQMARAVGIHLVVATQRPSVDVVTGLIKANIPSRIALMTSSQADSRVILDMNGAEKLVGHGDMLFAPSTASKPARLQAAWVTEKEISQISEWIRAQRPAVYEMSVEGLGRAPAESEDDHGLGGDDELLEQAADLVVRSQLGSTSMLQRKLKVGFARAGRLMDLLEDRGIVGPSQGSKARDVLITPEEWEESRSARSA